jgi:hypothetical protein
MEKNLAFSSPMSINCSVKSTHGTMSRASTVPTEDHPVLFEAIGENMSVSIVNLLKLMLSRYDAVPYLQTIEVYVKARKESHGGCTIYNLGERDEQ